MEHRMERSGPKGCWWTTVARATTRMAGNPHPQMGLGLFVAVMPFTHAMTPEGLRKLKPLGGKSEDGEGNELRKLNGRASVVHQPARYEGLWHKRRNRVNRNFPTVLFGCNSQQLGIGANRLLNATCDALNAK